MARSAQPAIDPELLRAAAAALRGCDWRAAFSRNAAARGEQLCESGFVTLDRVASGSDAGSILVKATVHSQTERNTRYKVAVELSAPSTGLFLEGECTCPMALQCKHAAAVICELLDECDEEVSDVPASVLFGNPNPEGTRQALMDDLARKAAEMGFQIAELFPGARNHPLTESSRALADANRNPREESLVRVDPADAGNLRAWNDWLLRFGAPLAASGTARYELSFLLKCQGQRLTVQMLGRKPDAKGRQGSFKTLPDLFAGIQRNPWAEIEPADQPVLERLFGSPRIFQYSNDRALAGEHGRKTLEALLQRGCLLDGPSKVVARMAASRKPEIHRAMLSDGSQRLVVSTLPPAEIVTLDGLWYVDERSGEIGPIEGIGEREFEQISRAPLLRPSVHRVLATQLSAIPSLPAPTSIETRLRRQLTGARLDVLAAPDLYFGATERHFGARLSFRYDDVLVEAGDHAGSSTHLQGHVRTIVEHDRRGEQGWVRKLRDRDLVPFSERYFRQVHLWISNARSATAESWLELADPLRAVGFEVVYGADFPLRLEPDPDAWFADLEPREGSPWFDLELGIRIGDETVSLLPILVKALASKSLALTPAPNERPDATWLAPLDEQRRVRLPLAKVRALVAPILEWLDQLGRGTSLKLPLLRADVADAYGELDLEVRAATTLTRLAQALKAGSERVRIETPSTLTATLRDYQLDGLVWLDFLARHQLGGLLADDMGLGKTVQVLAHLLSEKAQGRLQAPVLIVMPTSVVPNWQAEAARFAPTLKLLTLHGGARKAQFVRAPEFDVILTTYALLPRDHDALAAMHFDLAVFDEAQAIKNPLAKAAQCARSLDATRRLVMTGTPLENHLGELWAQMDLVLPGLLGGRREFTTHFRTPIEKHSDADKRERLARRLRPFLLRRTKQQVARELPPKTEIIQRIELEGPQREFYESLRLAMHERVRKAIKARGVGQSSIVVLDALLKLRQVCCDPALVKLPAAAKQRASAKRTALMELLEPLLAEGRRVLLFSQFTEMLDLIQHELDERSLKYVRLDGSTRDRAAPVLAFQGEQVPLMLISLKAGGVGLNLTAADTVIHYDPWWNPAVENQATDRAHRIGQDKPVFVYKLVCTDTVEDKIIALQSRKAELASAILDGGTSTSLQFDEATIEELLGAG